MAALQGRRNDALDPCEIIVHRLDSGYAFTLVDTAD
jgi:hypothetical protein